VLRGLTPVESLSDVDSLREYLQNQQMKTEVSLTLFLPTLYSAHITLKLTENELKALNDKILGSHILLPDTYCH
jgi:hypothetical protein